MGKRLTGLRIIAAPVAIVTIVGFTGTGCDAAKDAAGGCVATVEARVTAFNGSVDALVAASADMKAKLVTACAGIAGTTPPANPTDDDVTTICGNASTEINAQFTAAGGVTVTINPGGCTVNAQAQFDCEANCSASAECNCQPGTIEARCTPAELSGTCSADCSGTCRAEGGVAVSCTGSCEGTCNGTCSGKCTGTCSGTCSAMNADGSCAGTCSGTCGGKCEASCDGTCEGECTAQAGGTIQCDGTCKGGCSVAYTAPKCEAELTPPSCDCQAAADCNASCDGQASIEATCTPPTIEIVAQGTIDATFLANFQANFPTVLQVAGKATIVAQGMGQVVSDAGGIVGALSTTCVAEFGASLGAKASAAVNASASVNVSVQASADVSAKGSTG